MPLLYVFIGVPGVGKSTYRNSTFTSVDYKIISSDDVIERIARHFKVSYSDAFICMPFANQLIESKLKKYIANGENIVWDQTNTTIRSRMRKLAKFGDNYRKIAIYFETPSDIMQSKPYNRPGKQIPDEVVAKMISDLQPPEAVEKWDEVRIIKRST